MFETEYKNAMEKITTDTQWRAETLQRMAQAQQQPMFAPVQSKPPVRVHRHRAGLIGAAAALVLLAVPVVALWQGVIGVQNGSTVQVEQTVQSSAAVARQSDADAPAVGVEESAAEESAAIVTESIADEAGSTVSTESVADAAQSTSDTAQMAVVTASAHGVVQEVAEQGIYLLEDGVRVYYACRTEPAFSGLNGMAWQDLTGYEVTVDYVQAATGERTALEITATAASGN